MQNAISHTFTAIKKSFHLQKTKKIYILQNQAFPFFTFTSNGIVITPWLLQVITFFIFPAATKGASNIE